MTATEIQGYPLSAQQQHLWQLASAGDAASVQCLYAVGEGWTPQRLTAAWRRVASRHGILRTSFHHVPGFKTILQSVADDVVVPPLEHTDLGELPVEQRGEHLLSALRAQRRASWTLEEAPLARWHLFEGARGALDRDLVGGPAAGERLLAVTLPALCADARTLDHLAAGLAAVETVGETPAADEAPVQFVELAEWQTSLLEDQDAEAATGRAWWRARGAALATEPRDEATAGAPRGLETVAVPLRGEPWVEAPQGTERADLWLAAWQAFLLRRLHPEAERHSIPVAVAADARRFEELADVLGPATRWLPVVVEVRRDEAFSGLADRVATGAAEARAWQDVYPVTATAGPSLGFEYRVDTGQRDDLRLVRQTGAGEPFQLCLSCRESGGAVTAELIYDPAWRSPGEMDLWADQLAALVLAGTGSTPVGELSLLSADERRRWVVEWNDTDAADPAQATVAAMIGAQAARTPAAAAVRWHGGELSFADLVGRAATLAHRLVAAGVGPEVPVPLVAGRTPGAAIGLLAVLQAGGAFAPLDPELPPERLRALVAELDPPLVLGEGEALTVAAGIRPTFDLAAALDLETSRPPAVAIDPENLAYVMYTSGSTGRPKGVMVPHRGLVSYLEWCRQRYGLGTGGVAAVHSSLGFDLTLTALLTPWVTGASAWLIGEGDGVDRLAAALDERRLDLLKLTPAHLEMLGGRTLRHGGARHLVVGGEALHGEAVAAWRAAAPDSRIFNEYGPTEAVVGCTVFEVPPGPVAAGPVPIGRPIDNARIYLVDRALTPAARGVPGEIWIGGLGVARGYLGRPAETALRFVPDALSGRRGERLYRSGDLARLDGDGELRYLGRADAQMKIRGVRVEAGEVEAALVTHPAVAAAAVAAWDGRLWGYLVARTADRPGVEELQRFLETILPAALIPASFAWLDRLPLTANGKLDRRSLPEPDSVRPELEQRYVAPRNALEAVLAEVWSQVLQVDDVGVHDNFFRLGGDSIRSVRVVALAKERGLALTVQDLFRLRTVEALAGELATRHRLVDPSPGAEPSDDELLALLEEIEGLPEHGVQERLREQLAVEGGEA